MPIARPEPAAKDRPRLRDGRAASASRAFVATCLVIATCLASTAEASASPSVLPSGSKLNDGSTLTSPNGQYTLVMQHDGNLVEYTRQDRVIWASMTFGGARSFAAMQTDGNLVVYSAAGQAQYSSGTNGHGVPTMTFVQGSYLALQNDANLVVYSPSGQPRWATDQIDSKLMPGETLLSGEVLYSPNEQYRLVMQSDGNLVEYNNATSQPVWATYRFGQGNSAVMQTDGNLVVYSSSGRALWQSGTFGHGAAYLELKNEDSMFVRGSGGTLLWGANRAWGQTLASNGFPYGQCTWYAEEQFHANTGSYLDVSGNAGLWAGSAAQHGWTVVSTPQIYSIVVFPPNVNFAGSVGHVAWVTNVNGWTITVTEMNYVGWGKTDTRTVTVDPTKGVKFILAP